MIVKIKLLDDDLFILNYVRIQLGFPQTRAGVHICVALLRGSVITLILCYSVCVCNESTVPVWIPI